jgi:hypothetical protein
MKLLSRIANHATIKLASQMNQSYEKPVIFHCYWNGQLNEKHLYSIKSCYYFNIYKNNYKQNKIILWLEGNIPNQYNDEIQKYAEIRVFSLYDEIIDTFLEHRKFTYNSNLSFYSDTVRYMLLYKYGGCWFDLDCLFLRSFSPLFCNYENDICVYQWEQQNHPNGAIYISLQPFSEKMRYNIEFIIERNRGWGFQEAELTYDLPMELLVLPCSWFDASWIKNPLNLEFNMFFKNTNISYNFDTFFKGAFCYHWHNMWNVPIEKNSIMQQLMDIINMEMV